MSQLDADSERIRSLLANHAEMFAQLRDESEQRPPNFSPAAAGAGFALQGDRLALALQRLHEASVRRHQNRLHHFDRLGELNDTIQGTDELNASELRTRGLDE
ncbi:hypothetical protein QP027_01720 [Corynebacterium breve]|uniref:Uncharacterized protein n=1 Tax=Corynebacterium breve TaxID=3049799 RepID=A0ABY8VF59_9CORY|nr:hypothetical protein [Corynebacterium breve]WIM68143.1 hypothetical protein QP027_01720 [Corynebacterium breve]